MAMDLAEEMGVNSRLRFLRSGRASMPVATGLFRALGDHAGRRRHVVREPAACRAAARARARQAPGLPDARAGAGRVRVLLVQSAGLAGGQAGARRARAGLRRSGPGLRHARLRIRRPAARDGSRTPRRPLPGAARRCKPRDGASVPARRPADGDPRPACAPLGPDPNACSRRLSPSPCARSRRWPRCSRGRRTPRSPRTSIVQQKLFPPHPNRRIQLRRRPS